MPGNYEPYGSPVGSRPAEPDALSRRIYGGFSPWQHSQMQAGPGRTPASAAQFVGPANSMIAQHKQIQSHDFRPQAMQQIRDYAAANPPKLTPSERSLVSGSPGGRALIAQNDAMTARPAVGLSPAQPPGRIGVAQAQMAAAANPVAPPKKEISVQNFNPQHFARHAVPAATPAIGMQTSPLAQNVGLSKGPTQQPGPDDQSYYNSVYNSYVGRYGHDMATRGAMEAMQDYRMNNEKQRQAEELHRMTPYSKAYLMALGAGVPPEQIQSALEKAGVQRPDTAVGSAPPLNGGGGVSTAGTDSPAPGVVAPPVAGNVGLQVAPQQAPRRVLASANNSSEVLSKPQYAGAKSIFDRHANDSTLDDLFADLNASGVQDYLSPDTEIGQAIAGEIRRRYGQQIPSMIAPIGPGSSVVQSMPSVARRMINAMSLGGWGETPLFSDPVEESKKRARTIDLWSRLTGEKPTHYQIPEPGRFEIGVGDFFNFLLDGSVAGGGRSDPPPGAFF